MLPSELFKLATITPLQAQVTKLGVCPNCHKKRLRHVHSCEQFSSWQCTKCLHIYMLEPQPTPQEGEESVR